MMGPSALSTTVVNRALRTVPYPLLGENTLCLSDSCILAPDDEGNMALMFRSRTFCLLCITQVFVLRPSALSGDCYACFSVGGSSALPQPATA